MPAALSLHRVDLPAPPPASAHPCRALDALAAPMQCTRRTSISIIVRPASKQAAGCTSTAKRRARKSCQEASWCATVGGDCAMGRTCVHAYFGAGKIRAQPLSMYGHAE